MRYVLVTNVLELEVETIDVDPCALNEEAERLVALRHHLNVSECDCKETE